MVAFNLGPASPDSRRAARSHWPVVDTTLPNPNGYDEIVAIGNRLGNSAISKELDQDVIDTARRRRHPAIRTPIRRTSKALDFAVPCSGSI